MTDPLVTKHEHGSGCVNTYPDCDYPDDIAHVHGGVLHSHPANPEEEHAHPEWDVPDSPGNYPSRFSCTYYDGNSASSCFRQLHPGSRYCKRHTFWAAKRESKQPGCTLPACDNETPREGQPCDPCDTELGAG